MTVEQQIDCLLGLHNCTWQVDPPESLKILARADKLSEKFASKRAKILYEIGFTYRKMDDIERAVDNYKEALKEASLIKDKELVSTILNDLGYALLFMSKYTEAQVYVERSREYRRKRVEEVQQKLDDITQQLRTASAKSARLLEQQKSLNHDLHDARLRLGYTFNTLGEISRFSGDLARATGEYSEALSIFKSENSYIWQVKALHSRSEAHRRIAKRLFEDHRLEASEEFDAKTYEDISSCLVLCEQYGYETESDTAYRRMGRLLHDRAFRTNNLKQKMILLDQAKQYFEKGLQIAQHTKDFLEELENLTEIAFLVNDRLSFLGVDHETQEFKDMVEKSEKEIAGLRNAIENHPTDKLKIYHFSVFASLLKLAEGAFQYVQGNFSEALKAYIKAYSGLASDPGYGSVRYRQHRDHLLEQLKGIRDAKVEKKWCDAFIKAWEKEKMQRTKPPQTLAQVHPDLLQKLRLHMMDTGYLDEV